MSFDAQVNQKGLPRRLTHRGSQRRTALCRHQASFKSSYLQKQKAIKKSRPEAENLTKPIPERDHRELAEKIFAQDPNSLALANTWHQRNLSPLEEIRGMDLARISSHCEDDFNRLIKKLRVSFSEKLAEAQFSIEEGIFHGARFHLTAEDRDLTIKISQIAMPLKLLLSNNREVLKTRLAQHEINLCDMRFI